MFPANPIAGFIGGATVGYIYSVVSVVQSLAAGIAADVVWTEGQNAKVSNIWQQKICYQWTWSMQGDRDNLIWFFNIQNEIWMFGMNNAEWCNFLYWNTYFDLGPWAGPGDSLMPFAIWFGYCLTIAYGIFKFIGGLSVKFALLAAAAVFVVGCIIYVVTAGILHLLKKWNLLPNIYVADPYKGDYQPG